MSTQMFVIYSILAALSGVKEMTSACTPEVLLQSLIHKETMALSGVAEIELVFEQGNENFISIGQDTPFLLRFVWSGRKKFSLSQITPKGTKLLIASDGRYVLTDGRSLWENAFLFHFHSGYKDDKNLIDRFESEMALLTEIVLSHLMPIGRISLLADHRKGLTQTRWSFKCRSGGITPDPEKLGQFLRPFLVLVDASVATDEELRFTMSSPHDPPTLSIDFFGEKGACILSRLLFKSSLGSTDLEYALEPALMQLPARLAHSNYTYDSSETIWTTRLLSFGLRSQLDVITSPLQAHDTSVKVIDADDVGKHLQTLEKLNLEAEFGNNDSIPFDWGQIYKLNRIEHFDFKLRMFFIRLLDSDSLSTESIIDILNTYASYDIDTLLIRSVMYVYICIAAAFILIIIYLLSKAIYWGKKSRNSNSSGSVNDDR